MLTKRAALLADLDGSLDLKLVQFAAKFRIVF